MKGGENALFYWGYGHFRIGKFTISKICKNHSLTIYLQLVFEPKISTIITTKKNERMKQMKITYREVNGYLIPNLKLPPEETNIRLGKWGMVHKDYLEKHKTALFNSLIIKGKLYQHCAEVEKQTNEMFETLVKQMKAAECVAEQLKEENQMEWVRRMNNIEARAKDIVYSEIIYK